ncbi:hypothetical protein AB0G81_27835, partial [Streptomyces asoensis]
PAEFAPVERFGRICRADPEEPEDFVAHVRGAAPDAREQRVLRDAFDAVRADDTVREVAR